jgi:hypothetical protein
MKINMSSADRMIRVVLVAIFAYLYFSGTVVGIFGLILLILAIVFLGTSIIGFCPIYKIFGVSTCKASPKDGTSK